MPVDVVNTNLNAKDLVIETKKDKKPNIVIDALGKEKVEEMKKAVYDESYTFYDRYNSMAALILLGEMKIKDIPGYPETIDWDLDWWHEWQILTDESDSAFKLNFYQIATSIIARRTFSSSNWSRSENATQNQEDYNLLKRGVRSYDYEEKFVSAIAMATCFPYLFSRESEEWKENLKEHLQQVLMSKSAAADTEACIAYKLIFPEDNFWRDFYDDIKSERIEALKNKRHSFLALTIYAQYAIYLRLLTADRVEITNRGLIVEDTKAQDEQKDNLPERRKY